MGGIVSNASPLIYLAKAGRMGLLRKAFGEAFIPDARARAHSERD
jgi:predicted nucleic acid-binding protein